MIPALSDRDRGGSRDGWLNLGGFVQYTLVEDVDDQFLLTGGLRWEVPSGEADVFQGHGPMHMSAYLTAGKEFCEFHVLTTAGYQFPLRSGDINTDLFYAVLHLDRRVFGWLYPLVEFNWAYHTTSVDLSDTRLPGFIDGGFFQGTGNIVTLAAGFNAVIVQNRLEFGAVYTRSIAAQHDFEFNGLLVKSVLRY